LEDWALPLGHKTLVDEELVLEEEVKESKIPVVDSIVVELKLGLQGMWF